MLWSTPDLLLAMIFFFRGKQKRYLHSEHADPPSLSTKLGKLFGSTIFSWILVSPEHSEDQFR